MDDLKPCPFCGGDAQIRQYGTSRQSTQYECLNCGCSLETGEARDHGAAWNTRAAPKVKPIRWTQFDLPAQLSIAHVGVWDGVGQLGFHYEVIKTDEGWHWYEWDCAYQYSDPLPDADAAKAAAQADYERRILSALEAEHD